ncbi:hypothetical protein HY636_03385 [Candidatus Woesearchaeota archaeon]|nr:hypothetical protein [Candidatus Woesearchaeota archaeon]
MEFPSTDSIRTAQKDLEKRLIEQRNYEGKSAALRLLGFSFGTAAAILGFRYLTEENFYTITVPSLFSAIFLCEPNVRDILYYLADITLGEKVIVENSVKIDANDVVRINKLAPKVEYNASKLKSEPQKYLDEQIKYFQEAKSFFEEGQKEIMQGSNRMLFIEADVRNSERFEPEELVRLKKSAYKVYYSLMHLIRGKTWRSSMYKIILEDKHILSVLQLVAAALNYGIEFYSIAQTQPENKPFIEKIGNCIALSTDLHWLITDIAVRQQQKIGVRERVYTDFSSSAE